MRPTLERNSRWSSEDKEPRDVVLGAPALLGIFFAVALVCAVCFGWGFSRGHGWLGLDQKASAHSAPPEPKPPVGGVALAPAATKPAPGIVRAPEAPDAAPSASWSAAHGEDETAAEAPPSANLMVQIAAVTRGADAETLARALRRDGFAAVVRTSKTDRLFHVQLGPFPTLASARAMRARLTDGGYNAFIKP